MTPKRVGLYNPAFEHDSCGVAMVVDMHGRRSRDIVDKSITALLNLEHRGAQGAEPRSGDGAGILIQVPDAFLRDSGRSWSQTGLWSAPGACRKLFKAR